MVSMRWQMIMISLEIFPWWQGAFTFSGTDIVCIDILLYDSVVKNNSLEIKTQIALWYFQLSSVFLSDFSPSNRW